MPIKEYQCNNQQCPSKIRRFERLYKSHSDADRVKYVTVCDECGMLAEPVFSITGAPQFKGSGFYQTDYKTR